MEFKKCNRCGSFFMSGDTNICYDCSIKDRIDIAKLNSIIDNTNIANINELSISSGIKLDNINRFIKNKSCLTYFIWLFLIFSLIISLRF